MTLLANFRHFLATICLASAILATALPLSGCGQKGPLVLPPPPVPEPAVKVVAEPVVENAQPAATNNKQ